jgi:transposase
LDCEVEAIVSCLTEFGHLVQKVGFEAGTMSQTLFYGLQAAGYDVVCMEARHVSAALSAMRNKTDKNDVRGIAQIVRSGWYRPVHMKSREAHYIRALLTSRKVVLRKCVDLENEIRGLFKAFGIRLPSPLSTPSLKRLFALLWTQIKACPLRFSQCWKPALSYICIIGNSTNG